MRGGGVGGVSREWIGVGRKAHQRLRQADQGFAAVDALVALTLLSMTIGLSLVGAQTAQRAAAKAQEARGAASLLRSLLEDAPAGTADRQGSDGAFAWRYAAAPLTDEGAAPPLRLCRRVAEAASLKDRRRYRLETLAPCPAQEAG